MCCLSIIFIFHFSTSNQLRAQYVVERLGPNFNTPGSETGAARVGDTVLAYSTMERREAEKKQFAFDNAQMVLMQSRISSTGKLSRPKPCRWGLNSKRDHTGNLCIDPVNGDLYFTHARRGDTELRSEIWTARKMRRGWDKPTRLQGDINGSYTSTHPTVGRLPDGTIILYYSSNRPDGIGGMDIWYTIVVDGNCRQSVNLGPQVNSPADEITPYYDQTAGVLYFSSDRPGGLGGHDIYCTVGQRNTWQQAEHTCNCLNCAWNDIYFTITEHDPASGMPLSGYLSSNRPTEDDSTACCNDLYHWSIDSTQWAESSEQPDDTATASEIITTDIQPLTASQFLFPLFLYFHNDEPDPRSTEATTMLSYTDCQRHYSSLRDEYMSRQNSAEDSATMQLFFDTCVEGNYRLVEALFDYIEKQLDQGATIELTVAGYASPLHSSEYNQTLSERRIASFINMIRAWRSGLLANAMDDDRLTIIQYPRGIDQPTSSQHHTTSSQSTANTDPIYGLSAAMSRRIEIISCEVKH